MDDEYFTTSSDFTTSKGNLLKVYSIGESELLVVCIHGCGLSARSFGPLAKILSSLSQVLAFDLPSHGHSAKSSLSLDNLIHSTVEIVKEFGRGRQVLLIGHSLGAVIAIKSVPLIDRVLAVVLIEFYQPKNLDKLTTHIPKTFGDYERLLKYVVEERRVNLDYAKYCIETQVARVGDNEWLCHPDETKACWPEWYKGANQMFLKLPSYKILCLTSHVEDPELIVAHMQGKFQLEIISGSTHFIHECKPEVIGNIVKVLLKRMRSVYIKSISKQT